MNYHNDHRSDLVVNKAEPIDLLSEAWKQHNAYVGRRPFGESIFLGGGGNKDNLEISKGELEKWQKKCIMLYDTDVYYRSVIQVLLSLMLGTGPKISIKDENGAKRWKAFYLHNGMAIKIQQIFRTALITGEAFLRFFEPSRLLRKQGAGVKVRLVSPLRVKDIETDPEDFETVRKYQISKTATSGEQNSVNALEIEHIKLDPFGTRKRGTPFVSLGAIKKLERYDLFEYTRLLLNVIRASIPLVHSVKGSPDQIKAAADDFNKMPAPGSVATISLENEKLEFPQLNINANDTIEDGNKLLRGVAADTGLTMDFMSGEIDLKAGQRLLEPGMPVVKMIESLQSIAEYYLDRIVSKVVGGEIEREITMPRVAMRNLQSDAQGLTQFKQEAGISPVQIAEYLGLDYEAEVLPSWKRILEQIENSGMEFGKSGLVLKGGKVEQPTTP